MEQEELGQRARLSRTLALLLFAGAGLTPILFGAGSSPDPFGELLQHSPFKAAAATHTPAGPGGEILEFRSVVQEAGRTLFSIHDPATRRSVWLALHEESKGFSVQAYDAGRDRVTVAYQGRVLNLPLKRAVVTAQSMPVATVAVAANGKAGSSPAAPGKSQAELIREELARRRALRGIPAIASKPPANRG